MSIEIPEEDVDLVIRALEHYYAYTVARNAEDVRYKEIAERLKRKPAERVPGGVQQLGKASKRKA